MSAEPEGPDEFLLRKLADVGQTGLAMSKLLGTGKKTLPARREALQKLLESRKVGNLGTEEKPRYVLDRFFKPLELSYAAVEAKATPGKATTYLASELAKGCAGAVREKVNEAIRILVGEKKLLRLQRGKTVLYLHADSIRTLVNFSTPNETATTEYAPQDTLHVRIARSCQELARESGFSDVRISDLQSRSGVELEELKSWIVEQSRAGKVLPTRGDWSLADAEARGAAVEIGGEQHLRVRML
jgi:hypothetical protein